MSQIKAIHVCLLTFLLIFLFLFQFTDKIKMKLRSILMLISAFLIRDTLSQSNYASHANNVGYLGEGLPEEATLDGKVSFSLLLILVSFKFYVQRL